jgi:hypothetical protein
LFVVQQITRVLCSVAEKLLSESISVLVTPMADTTTTNTTPSVPNKTKFPISHLCSNSTHEHLVLTSGHHLIVVQQAADKLHHLAIGSGTSPAPIVAVAIRPDYSRIAVALSNKTCHVLVASDLSIVYVSWFETSHTHTRDLHVHV